MESPFHFPSAYRFSHSAQPSSASPRRAPRSGAPPESPDVARCSRGILSSLVTVLPLRCASSSRRFEGAGQQLEGPGVEPQGGAMGATRQGGRQGIESN